MTIIPILFRLANQSDSLIFLFFATDQVLAHG